MIIPNVSKRFFSETTWTIETKLPRNDHWKVLYKVCVFMPIGNPRWPPPQDIDYGGGHLGFPIGIKTHTL
jgi:hypothetical protein